MNILPFVSGFILLFAIGSYTFVHQFRAMNWEKKSYFGALQVERDYANRPARALYHSYKGEELHKKEKTASPKEEKFLSPRDTTNPCPEAKLCLQPLIAKEDPTVRSMAISLVKVLYEIPKKVDAEQVVDIVVKVARKNPKVEDFPQLLCCLEPEEAALLYPLIKGTHQYKLRTKEGYPPLGDFFLLKGRKKSVNFSYATRPLLIALFGERIGAQVIAKEKEKWEEEEKNRPLKKEELAQFLLEQGKNLTDFEPLIQFGTAKTKTSKVVLKDNATSIQLKLDN